MKDDMKLRGIEFNTQLLGDVFKDLVDTLEENVNFTEQEEEKINDVNKCIENILKLCK